MKKRSKKKAKKITKQIVIGILKFIFILIPKSIWWAFRKLGFGILFLFRKVRKKGSEGVVRRKKPKAKPKPDLLKEVKHQKGKLAVFEHKLFTNKSMIGIILGARGTGKSAIGMRLLENFSVKTNKTVYAMGFKPESVPCWIQVVSSVGEIKNNSVLLVDEGGIEFSSRKSMSDANNILSELLLIARHKDLSVLFITQNSSNLEVNAIRQADFLLLKPSSLLQKDFERKKIKDIYVSVDSDFEELKNKVGLTYIYSNDYLGFVSNTLPGFLSEKVSKGYASK